MNSSLDPMKTGPDRRTGGPDRRGGFRGDRTGLAHQRLDVSNDHGVKNCPRVREILEASGKVLLVLQGHSHANDLYEINGIHYCTLVAMIEGSGEDNNGYSLMEIDRNRTIRLTGFRNQKSHEWKKDA